MEKVGRCRYLSSALLPTLSPGLLRLNLENAGYLAERQGRGKRESGRFLPHAFLAESASLCELRYPPPPPPLPRQQPSTIPALSTTLTPTLSLGLEGPAGCQLQVPHISLPRPPHASRPLTPPTPRASLSLTPPTLWTRRSPACRPPTETE